MLCVDAETSSWIQAPGTEAGSLPLDGECFDRHGHPSDGHLILLPLHSTHWAGAILTGPQASCAMEPIGWIQSTDEDP